MRPLVMWGAKGQAKVLREFVEPAGFRLVALFDNAQDADSPFKDVPLYIGRDGFSEWLASGSNNQKAACLVAIGSSDGGQRRELQEIMEASGLEAIVAVHPTAFVAATAKLGAGCQILAQAAVCVDAVLGRACIVNTGASVDHESVLGDGVHVGPGATLAGCVEVGDDSFIGTGAVILPRIEIGRRVVVGAGAVVTRSVPDGVVVYGNPARVVRKN